jgi:hypothetical protein
MTIDSDLPPEVRASYLEEIRNYLPAFLRSDASEQHDPVGDVKELLNLEEGDLDRVVAVHGCLDPVLIELGEALSVGIRAPRTASARLAEAGQIVRGPVDWSATVARRSLEGVDPSRFVVRSARRVFDVPENRALAWVLGRLRTMARLAVGGPVSEHLARADAEVVSWVERIARLRAQVEAASRAEWLVGIKPEVPTQSSVARLKAARSSFYRNQVAPAVETMLKLENPSSEVLVETLSCRFFEPAQDWVVFEVYVALRLAREFEKSSGRPRKARLMVGAGGAPYARYGFDDGSEVSLILQKWPATAGTSILREVGRRQGLGSAPSRPDLFIVRTGPDPDLAVLELKATHRRQYLREGLVKLLGYLGECPQAWRRQPSGWLVAPRSEAFEDCAAEEQTLWLVSADRVAQAAVERFAPTTSS